MPGVTGIFLAQGACPQRYLESLNMAKRAQLPKSTAGQSSGKGASKPAPRNTRLLLVIVIGAVVLLVAGIVLLQMQGMRTKPPVAAAQIGAGAAWGPENAKVKILEYADYGCSHCRDFALNQGRQLRADYEASGNVRLEFKNFIVGGPTTATAANAALCAADQGRFWDYYEMLFSQQGVSANSFSKASLKQYGVQLGLNAEQFDQCVDADTHLEQVYRDSSEGQSQGVTGTPTFFIDGEKVEGAIPYADFKARVDAALAAAQ
jgi:protein-disulfide isomerase